MSDPRETAAAFWGRPQARDSRMIDDRSVLLQILQNLDIQAKLVNLVFLNSIGFKNKTLMR